MILEACVDSLKGSIQAEKNGAHRLELCADLDKDGLSPPMKLVEQVVNSVNIPVKVMVRPREGNFIYSKEEIDTMIQYTRQCTEIGIKEIVTGMLTEDLKINVYQLEKLALSIPDTDITFHKAIDLTNDPIEELKRCFHIENLKSVLTSGKKAKALDGLSYLKKMISSLQPRLIIIAAGKVTKENIGIIHSMLNASEYHGKKIV